MRDFNTYKQQDTVGPKWQVEEVQVTERECPKLRHSCRSLVIRECRFVAGSSPRNLWR